MSEGASFIYLLEGQFYPMDHTQNVTQFFTLHAELAGRQGLKLEGKHINKTVSQTFADERVTCRVDKIARVPIASMVLPEDLADELTISGWFEHIAKALTESAMIELANSHAKISSLIHLALSPEYLEIAGSEEVVRNTVLKFPRGGKTHDIDLLCTTRLKDMRRDIGSRQIQIIKDKVEGANLKIRGFEVVSRHTWPGPFLDQGFDIALSVSHHLTPEEVQKLIKLESSDCVKALEALISPKKSKFTGLLTEQLSRLSKRIKKLPHIELLTSDEIAQVVSPFFQNPSPNPKASRAEKALVAVEEKAREKKFKTDITRLEEHKSAYANVANYYPLARSLKRELILYVGPTNSGKTWRALNDLAAHDSGVYLAPLRLLALEGQEELEKRGKETSFITGEERELKPYAHFISSTIEMLNPEAEVGAVVIDEVQLITDDRRGWAWLAALLGAPAKRVIMTGSPDAVSVVETLAAYLGEKLTVVHCQRYNELKVASEPTTLKNLQPQTAIVCFSRRDVLSLKARIQTTTDFKVSVIYGNLSPQVRREEARRFRNGETEILVATDAIAMGLNLPIREVVFYATTKFNGEEVVPLTHSEIRQIGGRAGRYGFAQFGVVHALDKRGVSLIQQAFHSAPHDLVPPFYVAPGANHVQIISKVLNTTSLERILTFFSRAIQFSDPRFTRANIDDLSYLASFVDEILPFMDVAERLTIASAPVTLRSEAVLGWFLEAMLPQFSGDEEAVHALDQFFEYVHQFTPKKDRHGFLLREAEDYLRGLTVYAWLSYRYPDVFTRLEDCEARRDVVNAYIEKALHSQSIAPPKPKFRRGGGDRHKRW